MSPMSWSRNTVVRVEVTCQQANVLVVQVCGSVCVFNCMTKHFMSGEWAALLMHGEVARKRIRSVSRCRRIYVVKSCKHLCTWVHVGADVASCTTCEILQMVVKRSTSRLSRMHTIWRLSRSKMCPSEKKSRHRRRSEKGWNSIREALQFAIPRCYWTLFLACRTDNGPWHFQMLVCAR